MHWVVVPGDFEVRVGRSAQDIPLKGTLRVREQWLPSSAEEGGEGGGYQEHANSATTP
jgi:hypothetical protein